MTSTPKFFDSTFELNGNNLKKSYVNLKNIYQKEICWLNRADTINKTTYLNLLRKFIVWQKELTHTLKLKGDNLFPDIKDCIEKQIEELEKSLIIKKKKKRN